MTIHNLDEHLSWLLQRGPSLYPTLEYTPSATTEEVFYSVEEDHNTAVSPNDQVIEVYDSVARVQDGDLTVLVEDGGSTTGMGRLSIAPHSGNKPRMLSQMNPAKLNSLASAKKERTPALVNDQKNSQAHWKHDGKSLDPRSTGLLC